MIDLRFARYALSVCVAAAMLAGCGGAQLPVGAYGTSGTAQAVSKESTFKYTGSKQSFKVPAGVTQITVDASGAAGGSGNGLHPRLVGRGGLGGRVRATIAVTPKQDLAIFVGGSGREHGGYNGGGEGAAKGYGDGGGASDVRMGGDTLAERIIVAGGGGGGGGEGVSCGSNSCRHGYRGGNGGGGGRDGAAGGNSFGGGGGGGGDQYAGGDGGDNSYSQYDCDGAEGTLGNGGSTSHGSCGSAGGGGGGGYYGGGGGAAGSYVYVRSGGGFTPGGGGGGGSSFAESGAKNVKMTRGAKTANGDGQVIISWHSH
jgi:hypothetical protein